MDFFARQAVAYRNTLKQSCSSLLGLVSGLLADNVLSDDEIRFLGAWLDQHSVIATAWPGDVLHEHVTRQEPVVGLVIRAAFAERVVPGVETTFPTRQASAT